MIVITNLETMTAPEDIARLMDFKLIEPLHMGLTHAECKDLYHEVVAGHRFMTPDGEEIVIGATARANKVLGVYIGYIERIEEERRKYQELFINATATKNKAKVELSNIKKAGIFKRLWWVFTGVK